MLNLSWDLFIAVIFAVIIAYSFIIGRQNTVKVIIGSYIAILTADGLGNLFREYVFQTPQIADLMSFIGAGGEEKSMILIKVVVFITAIVIIAMKGGFEVHGAQHHGVIGIITNLIFGFLSAGLVISTLLIYVSGASFVDGNVNMVNNTLASAYADSEFIRLMIDNYNFWFTLPAVAFLISSLFQNKAEAMETEGE